MKIKEFIELIKENGFEIISNRSYRHDIPMEEQKNIKRLKLESILKDLNEFCEIEDLRLSETFFYRDDLDRMCSYSGPYIDTDAPNSWGICDSGFCAGNILQHFRFPNGGLRICKNCINRILITMCIGPQSKIYYGEFRNED